MARQIIVEFVGDVTDSVEPGPGNGGEVMMLVVEANVVGEPVERAVVGERLGDWNTVLRILGRRGDGLVNIMLSNEMASERMETASKEGG